ncbi:hypothetical protein BKA83DRAFT_4130187 [Pisolithus microcarpus]|nr:hypothetical protein BKA83DRAFT_4130187 [Pisolithus microcarpus]
MSLLDHFANSTPEDVHLSTFVIPQMCYKLLVVVKQGVIHELFCTCVAKWVAIMVSNGSHRFANVGVVRWLCDISGHTISLMMKQRTWKVGMIKSPQDWNKPIGSTLAHLPSILFSVHAKWLITQDIQKPGKESDLNPCLLPSSSQPSIPSSSNAGNFMVDTVCSSTTPMQSIDPLYHATHLTIQPPQRVLGVIQAAHLTSVTPEADLAWHNHGLRPTLRVPTWENQSITTQAPLTTAKIIGVLYFKPHTQTDSSHCMIDQLYSNKTLSSIVTKGNSMHLSFKSAEQVNLPCLTELEVDQSCPLCALTTFLIVHKAITKLTISHYDHLLPYSPPLQELVGSAASVLGLLKSVTLSSYVKVYILKYLPHLPSLEIAMSTITSVDELVVFVAFPINDSPGDPVLGKRDCRENETEKKLKNT